MLFFLLLLTSCFAKVNKTPVQKFYGEMPKVRIKDIANFEGVRDNYLVGYGLVVGLKGTGDDFANSPHAKESLISMLERLGINIRNLTLSGKNIAAVMVSASLPAFSKTGSCIDVNVSAIGSAKDLKGGTLLVTPLLGADGEVYAVAQGSVATSTIDVSGRNASQVKGGIPTNGKIMNGGVVEKQINFKLNSLKNMNISLKNPDFTTAYRMSNAINRHFGKKISLAKDSGTVKVCSLPKNPVPFLMQLEQLTFEPDQKARIVIDEQNGVVVMGHRVKIMPIAISHGSITIQIYEQAQVSQPNSTIYQEGNNNMAITQGGGETVHDYDTDINLEESKGGFSPIESGAYLDEFINSLNLLGVSPREMISILQNIKAAGALQADLIIT